MTESLEPFSAMESAMVASIAGRSPVRLLHLARDPRDMIASRLGRPPLAAVVGESEAERARRLARMAGPLLSQLFVRSSAFPLEVLLCSSLSLCL